MHTPNPLDLLKQKDILLILQGDTSVAKSSSGRDLRMPYLSAPRIIEISNQFGLSCSYQASGSPSRWVLMGGLVEHCIRNDSLSGLLNFLFSKGQFVNQYSDFNADEIEMIRRQITSSTLYRINACLELGRHQLKEISGSFCITPLSSAVGLDIPTIKHIDRTYITDLTERANNDIRESNFDSAITKARTLLEEVFCYVIEAKGVEPSNKGDIGKLYKQVKGLYNMHGSEDLDKRINELLSGLEKIVSSIAEIRNKNSDAHGVGSKRLAIKDYHARLMVNSAVAMGDFILSVANSANNTQGIC